MNKTFRKANGSILKVSGCALIVVFLAACGPSPETQKVCAALDEVINGEIKKYALTEIEGDMSDKSAMQQSARLTQNNNQLATIQINLELQAQNKCPPRQSPIEFSQYKDSARKCYSAHLHQLLAGYAKDETKAKAADAESEKECDFKQWNEPKKK